MLQRCRSNLPELLVHCFSICNGVRGLKLESSNHVEKMANLGHVVSCANAHHIVSEGEIECKVTEEAVQKLQCRLVSQAHQAAIKTRHTAPSDCLFGEFSPNPYTSKS